MKLKEKILWLISRVQRSLSSHLNECFDTRLTKQEQRLVTIFEVVQIEKYVPSSVVTQWLGRKPLGRQAIARAFVAKAVYRIPVTSDLRLALMATRSLRRICGCIALGDIPSESTFSRDFSDTANELGNRAHDALVKDYLGALLSHKFSQSSFCGETGSSFSGGLNRSIKGHRANRFS